MSATPGNKTKEQIRQEESDAALARRLQGELDAETNAAASVPPQAADTSATPGPTINNGVVTVACGKCTFLNEIKEPTVGKKYACIQCRTPLPIPESMMRTESKTMQRQNKPKTLECWDCGNINEIPNVQCDAFLCGCCHHALTERVQQPPRQTAPAPAPAPAHAPRSVPKQEPQKKSVQVRCGQCSSVNVVEVDSDARTIRFECGVCEVVNEVSLA